ncbi:MAG: TonB C-terminal domain-containing protein [Deltaproteobacteria bacterium]|nr:TonB C-terminal domain-containing protein [Deltaproteobacteria bacterium]
MHLQRQNSVVRFFATVGISFLFHCVFVLLLSLNPWHDFTKVRPTTYTVTLMPIPIPEPQIPPPSAPKEEKTKLVEKIKPIDKPKKDDIVEKVKKKERDKESLHRIQEALEEIRRKAALDEIQKRMTKREVTPPTPPSPSPSPSPSPAAPPALSPSLREAKLNEYYGLLWTKIKQSWTLPENILKERVDLEAIIVIIIERDGRIQKSWFEKKSGNTLYDQMAMRAVIKADPLPPIPKELNQESLEIGIRFFPD